MAARWLRRSHGTSPRLSSHQPHEPNPRLCPRKLAAADVTAGGAADVTAGGAADVTAGGAAGGAAAVAAAIAVAMRAATPQIWRLAHNAEPSPDARFRRFPAP